MLREASWSRSNSFWGTFRFKRRSATLVANSGFNQQSMIALASSRILESGVRLWKDYRQFWGLSWTRFRSTNETESGETCSTTVTLAMVRLVENLEGLARVAP